MRETLVERAAALADGHRRAILGIAGPPGAGKSTLAVWLTAGLEAAGVPTARVPMDGFHLADAALDRLGLRARKGAPETFDAWGYLALLRRLADGAPGETVYAPDFERTLEQPIAGSIGVESEVRLVVTEGNYLLLESAPWPAVRALLAETWWTDLDDAERQRRLVTRHIASGKTERGAREWVEVVDEPNARLIGPGRVRADLVVDMARVEGS